MQPKRTPEETITSAVSEKPALSAGGVTITMSLMNGQTDSSEMIRLRKETGNDKGDIEHEEFIKQGYKWTGHSRGKS